MKKYLLCICIVSLSACSSEDQIEKCVQAAIAAYGIHDKTKEEKAETEVSARLMCLKASGK